MTDPGAAEADLTEQEDLVDGTAMGLAGAVAGPEDGVPEADALDQQIEVPVDGDDARS